jgi:signal transduction histidine kinase
VRRHISARSRLTVLYTSLFALGGAALVSITYLLVAHTLQRSTPMTTPPAIRPALERCLHAASQPGGGIDSESRGCADVLAGVQAGAAAQRSTTLTHLLIYSLFTLACVILAAAVAGWIISGRILRPVRRITAAARAASEQNLSQRIALKGPRDELRELADTFDTMLDRLDRAFTSQRQFIANASHELRTPLTLMRTSIDVVLAKPEPTRDELVSMAADVRQAVDHSERLIEVLLILARNEQARLLTEPLDLATIAEDVLEGGIANGITTITTLDEAPVTGDGVLLERLVANLLDNAERYNVASGTVTISTNTDDGASLVRVANTGPSSHRSRSTTCSCHSRASTTAARRRLRARPNSSSIARCGGTVEDRLGPADSISASSATRNTVTRASPATRFATCTEASRTAAYESAWLHSAG